MWHDTNKQLICDFKVQRKPSPKMNPRRYMIFCNNNLLKQTTDIFMPDEMKLFSSKLLYSEDHI